MHVALALREAAVLLRRHGDLLLEGERHELERVAELARPQDALLAHEERADVAELHVVLLLELEHDRREVHPLALRVVVLHVLVDRHVVVDAVRPVELERLHARPRGKLVRERLARRPRLGAHVAHVLHRHRGRRRVHEVHRPERGVEHVVAHVAERAVAEAADVVPALAEVGAAVGAHLGRAHPQVPVHPLRRIDHGTELALGVEAVRPAPHLADLAERAALHVFGHERLERTRVAVVAGLRHDAVLARGGGEEVGLLLRVADRLLDVHVDAALHAGDGDRRVRLLVGGDDRRVDGAPHLVEEHAVVGAVVGVGTHLREVVVGLELLDAGLRRVDLRRVGVDHRHDLLVEALRHEHAPEPPAAPDEGEADLAPGRDLPRPALPEGEPADVEERRTGRHRGRALQETASLHVVSPFLSV